MIQFLFNFYVIEIGLLDLQILFCAFSMKKMISQWEHHILSIKACDAIRPEYNCYVHSNTARSSEKGYIHFRLI